MSTYALLHKTILFLSHINLEYKYIHIRTYTFIYILIHISDVPVNNIRVSVCVRMCWVVLFKQQTSTH